MNKLSPILSFLFLIFLNCGLCRSQNMDSLQLAFKTAKNDTTKLQVLIELSNQCQPNDILLYANPALELADKMLSDGSNLKYKTIKSSKAGAFNNIGFFYNDHGDLKKALDYWDKSIKL